jgi:5-methylcytosine-specific restriction endonuclease McrA
VSKQCKKCGVVYEDVAKWFFRRKQGSQGYHSPCLPCRRAKATAYKLAHPELVLRIQSERQAKKSPREIEDDRRRSAERYRNKHGEAMAAGRRFYRENRATLVARCKAYYREHKAEHRARDKAWKMANPEKVMLSGRNASGRTRALQYGVAHDVTAQQLADRVSMFGGRCWMCGAEWQEFDHVIPLSRGGPHIPSNIRPACSPCNRRKWAKRPSEMSA